MLRPTITEQLVRLRWEAEMTNGRDRMPYNTARWQKLRLAQLRAEPLCRMCTERGVTALASVCDHITPHRGNLESFWAGPFQSLCSACHNSDKQSIEKGGKPKQRFGADGWPA